MRRLVRSPRAVADLEAVREYIAQDSELYAALMVSRLVVAPVRLLQFPDAGRVVPEFAQLLLRELIVRPYRLVYRVRGVVIEIVTVFHAARTVPELPSARPNTALRQTRRLFSSGAVRGSFGATPVERALSPAAGAARLSA